MIATLSAALLLAAAASAAPVATFELKLVDASGTQASIGTVTATESKYGVVFTPSLGGLPAGLHGFHLHQNASCAPGVKEGKPTPALAAGDHYDPKGAKAHGAPWGEGHLGDLPPLHVGADGKATQPVLAPRLKAKDLAGRSLIVHAGGDNHADHPAPLGGGGARMACGVAASAKR
jgi:Cu-Zn family superoxide dismutase